MIDSLSVLHAAENTTVDASGTSRSSVEVACAKRRTQRLPVRTAGANGGPKGFRRSGYHVLESGATQLAGASSHGRMPCWKPLYHTGNFGGAGVGALYRRGR